LLGIYLTDLTQINDVQPDVLPDALPPLINFYKRQLLHTAMDSLLRFQSKPFIGLLEISTTLELIQSSLVKVKDIDPGLFAVKSQELMVMEVEHADIRKGLEAAGF
jgi:son of sevenless-like protein